MLCSGSREPILANVCTPSSLVLRLSLCVPWLLRFVAAEISPLPRHPKGLQIQKLQICFLHTLQSTAPPTSIEVVATPSFELGLEARCKVKTKLMSGRAGGIWQRNGDRAMDDGSYDDSQQSMQQGGNNNSSNSGSSSNRGNTSGAGAMSAPRPTPPTRSSSGRGFRRGSTWREANSNGPARRMEVSIPQKNLRVFASAVQCLMKVLHSSIIHTHSRQTYSSIIH